MPLLITGLPVAPCEIVGISPATKDTVLRYVGPTLKPRKWMLERMKQFDDIWLRFLQKLSIVPFFHAMTATKREEWLFNGAYETEMDIVEMATRMAHVAPVALVGNAGSDSDDAMHDDNDASDGMDVGAPGGVVACAHILEIGKIGKSKLTEIDEDLLHEWMVDACTDSTRDD